MRGCDEEMCPNWSGDGAVCPCALFDLPRPTDYTRPGNCTRPGCGRPLSEHEYGEFCP